jgi:hypothetical protein
MSKDYRTIASAICRSVILLCVLVHGMVSSALADESADGLFNKPFANFGAGFEYINFSEKLVLSGRKIDAGIKVFNPIQTSSGYIPLSSKMGLFLSGSKTLATVANSETWSAEGIGAIQQDDTKFAWTEVDAMAVYHLKPGHMVVGGINYTALNFSRFNFRPAAGTDAFNTSLGFGTLSQWVAAGNDPVKFPGLNPNAGQGTISEDNNALVAMVGYQYDTFFFIRNSPFRFFGGVKAGLPLFYMVENSTFPETTLVGTVDSGYDFGANMGMGWNFTKELSLLGSVDYTYKHRFRITSGNIFAPESDLFSVQSSIKLNWAF